VLKNMQRKLLVFFVQALAMSVALVASAHGTAHSAQRLRTQLHVIGDDGLTVRFADALRAAIAASPKFAPAVSGSPYDIRLLLAGNLYWQDTSQGLNFNVVVVVTSNEGRYLGVSTGACWEAHMQDCAQKVLSDALSYVAGAPNSSVNRTLTR
jgi:hypothetical protein